MLWFIYKIMYIYMVTRQTQLIELLSTSDGAEIFRFLVLELPRFLLVDCNHRQRQSYVEL